MISPLPAREPKWILFDQTGFMSRVGHCYVRRDLLADSSRNMLTSTNLLLLEVLRARQQLFRLF